MARYRIARGGSRAVNGIPIWRRWPPRPRPTTTPEPPRLPTTLHVDHARTIIARNHSPDIPFDQSINPYRGCEHGCIYCYARATHSYLDLSPGRDFETEIFYKPNAVELLRAELAAPGYEPSPIAFGTNTDPYQPFERELTVTRRLLELLLTHKHPITIVTKGALILRDLDLLRAFAEQRPRRGARERHDARRRAQAPHGTAHGGPEATPRDDQAIVGGRNTDGRDGGTHDSRAQRP